jgi:predicted DNA repair protein MutK
LIVVAGLLGFGLVFSVVAGVMAFLIAYDETGRHFPSRARARRQALGTGFAAFAFFTVLSVLLAILVPRIIGR